MPTSKKKRKHSRQHPSLRQRSEKLLKKRRRHKRIQRHNNRSKGGVPRLELKLRNRAKHSRKPTTRVNAPEVLSFLDNPEGVSSFISNLRELYEMRKPVWVSLRSVTKIDYDGITVLLSVMIRFKSQKIDFNGDYPLNMETRLTLQESGFFNHLFKSEFTDKDTYSIKGKSSIYTHAKRVVDSALGQAIIESASQTVWNEPRRCPGVQRTLIELMQNTNNHASLDGEGEKHWWLSVKHIEEENLVKFSFVDYGVGVFSNLRNKREGNKYYGVLNKIIERFRYGNNSDILKLIFEGELHRTASGKSYRGKGLPGVYQSHVANKISNLSMITNDVYYNSRSDEYRILKNPFQGTFVHWELNDSNTSITNEASYR